jgi:DNA-binding transcriptional MerR regulator
LTSRPERDDGGRRRYTEDDVAWLTTCRIFRSSGMPLAVIARFAELVREGAGNEEERLVLLREHEARMAAKLAEIATARDLICAKVESYEEHLARGTAAALWTR